MSTEETKPLSAHASAVAIGRRALLIVGPSRGGKSSLAYALLSASSRRRPIRFIGDDRIEMVRNASRGFLCRPHPRIAGFIERRGLGIVALPFVENIPLAAIVLLGPSDCLPPVLIKENFPALSLVTIKEVAERRDFVLRWWAAGQKRGMCTTPRQESACAPADRRERLELVRPTRAYICASRGDEAVRNN